MQACMIPYSWIWLSRHFYIDGATVATNRGEFYISFTFHTDKYVAKLIEPSELSTDIIFIV